MGIINQVNGGTGKMKLEEIEKIAEKYVDILKPYCERIEIAGSIRRRKEFPSDIEIVAQVKDRDGFAKKVEEWEGIRGSPYGKYTQRLVEEGVKLDIFITADDGSNYGNIMTIRTGSANFSHALMIRARRCGLKHKNGYLWLDGVRMECYDEKQFFKLLGMEWVSPDRRNW